MTDVAAMTCDACDGAEPAVLLETLIQTGDVQAIGAGCLVAFYMIQLSTLTGHEIELGAELRPDSAGQPDGVDGAYGQDGADGPDVAEAQDNQRTCRCGHEYSEHELCDNIRQDCDECGCVRYQEAG